LHSGPIFEPAGALVGLQRVSIAKGHHTTGLVMLALRISTNRSWLAIVAALVAVIDASTLAAEAVTGVVAERVEVMKQIASHMKALDQAMRSEQSTVTPDMKRHAEQIHTRGHGLLGWFPAGSGHGHTRAKPEIWIHRDEFERIAKSFDVAREELLLAAQVENRPAMQLHFKAITETCSECHEKFRVPGKR
jgi:cytochrome c556